MPNVTCFLIQPTGRARRGGRRYSTASLKDHACPRFSYHNALVYWDECPDTVPSSNVRSTVAQFADREWPTTCPCGYVFENQDRVVNGIVQHEDDWQVFVESLYRSEDGHEFLLRDALPGAMWRVTWYESCPWVGPDGQSWAVKLPDGTEWMMDAPSKDGGRWTREGVPPKVTCSPSIQSPKYHGWLRDGVLVD